MAGDSDGDGPSKAGPAWMLIDLDAAAIIPTSSQRKANTTSQGLGTTAGVKFSSGYIPVLLLFLMVVVVALGVFKVLPATHHPTAR